MSRYLATFHIYSRELVIVTEAGHEIERRRVPVTTSLAEVVSEIGLQLVAGETWHWQTAGVVMTAFLDLGEDPLLERPVTVSPQQLIEALAGFGIRHRQLIQPGQTIDPSALRAAAQDYLAEIGLMPALLEGRRGL